MRCPSSRTELSLWMCSSAALLCRHWDKACPWSWPWGVACPALLQACLHKCLGHVLSFKHVLDEWQGLGCAMALCALAMVLL